MAKLEELKAQYPQLWERATKRFSSPQAQVKYFRALVEAQKARELEKEIRAKERARDRRRRTRALILFAIQTLEWYARNGRAEQLRRALENNPLRGKEGKYEIDYTPYVLSTLEEFEKKFQEALEV